MGMECEASQVWLQPAQQPTAPGFHVLAGLEVQVKAQLSIKVGARGEAYRVILDESAAREASVVPSGGLSWLWTHRGESSLFPLCSHFPRPPAPHALFLYQSIKFVDNILKM